MALISDPQLRGKINPITKTDRGQTKSAEGFLFGFQNRDALLGFTWINHSLHSQGMSVHLTMSV